MSHTQEVRSEALDRYAAGDSLIQVARSVNVGGSTISRWARDAGINRPAGPYARRRTSELPPADVAYKGEWIRDGLIMRGSARDQS